VTGKARTGGRAKVANGLKAEAAEAAAMRRLLVVARRSAPTADELAEIAQRYRDEPLATVSKLAAEYGLDRATVSTAIRQNT